MSSPATKPSDRPFNAKSAASWRKWETQMDRQLEPFGRATLDALAVRPGERVLDVGCGCGATVLQLAAQCGPTGRVVGVDPAEEMLARAGERAQAAGYTNVELLAADAQRQPFARGSFDAIFSRFGVMFFDDPPAAFANLHQALAPGGRLGFVSWQPLERNPWALQPLRAVQDALGDHSMPAMLAPGQPGPFTLAEAEAVTALLRGAGFTQIEVRPLEIQVHYGAATNLEEAVTFALDIGPSARMAAERTPAERAACAEALRAALAPAVTARGVWFDGAAFVVTARQS